jgi:hypothetical protein
LRCAVGPQREDNALVNGYKKVLEWDIIKRPRLTQVLEKVLAPVLGKSYVLYSRKSTREPAAQ